LDVAGDDDGGDDMDMEDDTVWIPHHFTRFMELLEESFLQEDEHIDTIKGYAASVFFAVNLMNGPSNAPRTPSRMRRPSKACRTFATPCPATTHTVHTELLAFAALPPPTTRPARTAREPPAERRGRARLSTRVCAQSVGPVGQPHQGHRRLLEHAQPLCALLAHQTPPRAAHATPHLQACRTCASPPTCGRRRAVPVRAQKTNDNNITGFQRGA
jgi:hypothetical protein